MVGKFVIVNVNVIGLKNYLFFIFLCIHLSPVRRKCNCLISSLLIFFRKALHPSKCVLGSHKHSLSLSCSRCIVHFYVVVTFIMLIHLRALQFDTLWASFEKEEKCWMCKNRKFYFVLSWSWILRCNWCNSPKYIFVRLHRRQLRRFDNEASVCNLTTAWLSERVKLETLIWAYESR